MSDQSKEFVAVASEFCDYIESENNLPLIDRLQNLSLLLARLYITAMNMPDVEPTDRDFDIDVHVPNLQFDDVDGYWEVFDPYEAEESAVGSLMDDVGDIYRDVKRGLLIYERGAKQDISDAVWHWRFHFQAHWGFHLVDGLRAIHWAIQRVEDLSDCVDHEEDAEQQKNSTRDIVYVLESPQFKRYTYTGIEFHEWIACIDKQLDILLLQGNFFGVTYHNETNLTYVRKEELPDLLADDIYGYGNFVWVDFNSTESLDNLSATELAQLLYMSHTWKPLNTPFLSKLDNRFVYLAHDDGWLTDLYCKDRNDFETLISHVIPLKVKSLHDVDVPRLTGSALEEVLALLEKGLLIDFSDVKHESGTLRIPMFVIGQIKDMDNVLNNKDAHIGDAQWQMQLVYKQQWMVVE